MNDTTAPNENTYMQTYTLWRLFLNRSSCMFIFYKEKPKLTIPSQNKLGGPEWLPHDMCCTLHSRSALFKIDSLVNNVYIFLFKHICHCFPAKHLGLHQGGLQYYNFHLFILWGSHCEQCVHDHIFNSLDSFCVINAFSPHSGQQKGLKVLGGLIKCKLTVTIYVNFFYIKIKLITISIRSWGWIYNELTKQHIL